MPSLLARCHTDALARRQLVEQYTMMAYKLTNKFVRKYPLWIQRAIGDEKSSVAIEALLDAAKTYDKWKRAKFSHHLYWKVLDQVKRLYISILRQHVGNPKKLYGGDVPPPLIYMSSSLGKQDRDDAGGLCDKQKSLLKLLENLNERNQTILTMRFCENCSFRRISQAVGVCPERVRQIIKESKVKLMKMAMDQKIVT